MERPEMFDVESCNELGPRLQGLSVAAEPSSPPKETPPLIALLGGVPALATSLRRVRLGPPRHRLGRQGNAPRRPRVPRASPLIKRVGNTKADRVHLGVEVIRVLE